LILRPAGRLPIPVGAAVTIYPAAFLVERTVDPAFRGAAAG
jgi:hypothetical protein